MFNLTPTSPLTPLLPLPSFGHLLQRRRKKEKEVFESGIRKDKSEYLFS